MQWTDIPFDPQRRTVRQFAAIWLVFFSAMGIWQGVVQQRVMLGIGLGVLAAVVGTMGLIWPRAVRWIFVAWMVAAFPIGWLISRTLLVVMYYLIITPVALWFRLMRRDVLRRKPDFQATTYWTTKPGADDVRRYFRQF